jgi:porphobilinogen synthase
MVKPGLPYLDIISDAAQINPDIPVAVYQVSGEFAMIHAAADKGVVSLKDLAYESVEGMIRAGTCLLPLFCDRSSHEGQP